MKIMNITRIFNHLPVALKHSALALAVAMAVGLGAGSAQATTTTQTFNLGPQGSGTSISTGTGGFIPWITKGTLPAGSIVRSVSASIRLDSSTADSWTSDLLIYFDGAPEAPSTAALMQIGGDYSGKVGTVGQLVGWTGGDGGPGTTINETKTAGVNWTGDIDLNAVQLSLGNNYAASFWSGTITVEYDVSALTVALTSPAASQGYPTGTPVTVTATVVDPGITLTDTVTFHTTPIDPSGPTVHTVSTDTTSPFSADLGTLPAGTYEIYATVANNDVPPGTATSATTRTFTVAATIPTSTALATSTNPSTYGQLTVTATVSPTPTGGTVQFFNGFDYLGVPVAVNTSTGVASLNLNTLATGTHEISAIYNGHWLHAESTSSTLSQVVNKAPLTVKALNTLRAPNTANPDPLPYQITGYQNGQVFATSGVAGAPTLTTDAILSSPPANYVITCTPGVPPGGLTASNYSFTCVDGTLTVVEMVDTFSVNFYSYGNLPAESQANVLMTEGLPAGLGDWFTSGWTNVLSPWGGNLQPAKVLTSNKGTSTATFIFKDSRNGWQSWGEPRTTNLGDGNYNMMGSGVNSTLDPGDGSAKFDMEMTGIPFAVYDVIFYIRANQPQYGDGTGVIVFNGGAERAFKLKSGAFDGTFTEMVDATTVGNYIVFKGVTGSSFTTQTWGTGSDGFNHLGPAGFQVREAAGYTGWASTHASGQSPSEDYDNDGVENGLEYFMGQTGSSFTAMPGLDANNKVTWTKNPNYRGTWQVQTSINLSTWIDVVGTEAVDGTSVSYTLPTGEDRKFVRMLVTPTP